MNKNNVREIVKDIRSMFQFNKNKDYGHTTDPIEKLISELGFKDLHDLLNKKYVPSVTILEKGISIFANTLSRRYSVNIAIAWLAFWYNGKLYKNGDNYDYYSFDTFDTEISDKDIALCKKMLKKKKFCFKKNSFKYKMGFHNNKKWCMLDYSKESINEKIINFPWIFKWGGITVDSIMLTDYIHGGRYEYRVVLMSENKPREILRTPANIKLVCDNKYHKDEILVNVNGNGYRKLPGEGEIICFFEAKDEHPFGEWLNMYLITEDVYK
jgi:hypothetical protein